MSFVDRKEKGVENSGEGNPVRRILDAAGETFVRDGFRRATVRDICRKARVNVAAVNYYFGDKAGLYKATLDHFRGVAFEKHPFDTDAAFVGRPDEALRAFIRVFAFRVLDEGRASWFGRLVAREYIEPSAALDGLVGEIIRPTYLALASIVGAFFKRNPGEDIIRLCCMSVISQSLFFLYARPILDRLFAIKGFEPHEVEQIALHIWRFSVKGIREIAGGGQEVCA